ncbi:hypothetical protein [Kushneria aurantia]|uniref:Uncharacterized protein n=1 Tax=Kushneria aurantia TaxID=504092 RepID=A0ABV6G7Y6_9GAMM|nr:hypothetical protein [Kushneria aurantia]
MPPALRFNAIPRFLLTTPLLAATLLTGCLALPQAGLMLGRVALESMGVENVRIGRWDVPTNALTLDPMSLARAGLNMNDEPPVQFDLPLALVPPSAAPVIELAGYAWQLAVPGAEPVSGEVAEPVTLEPGERNEVTLPVALKPAISPGEKSGYTAQLLGLAQQLAGRNQLPAGSMLSLTPRLAGEMARLVPAPTITLEVGGEQGSGNAPRVTSPVTTTAAP